MEDKQILELYWARAEAAITETQRKYGRYCHYIASRILGSDQDAQEVVNDTFLKAWNTIPPQRPDRLKAYVGRISRQLALNRYEARHAQKRGGQVELALEELAQCVSGADQGDMADELALRQALNQFVRSLPHRTRAIFLRRYWYASDISEIARDFAMSERNVAVLLHRTRKKLREFLKKEGFEP